MAWHTSQCTHVWIFSVGRGNAAFVRTGLNQGFVIDMGKNGDFDPAAFIEKEFLPKLTKYPAVNGKPIAQALLSHPHSDHISQCEWLAEGKPLNSNLLTCPHHKDYSDGTASDEKLNWDRIVNPQGSDELVKTYQGLYVKRNLPLQTIQYESSKTIPNHEYGIFYLRPPVCETLHESDDNKYGNATSVMLFLRHGNHTILFPGDMTPEGMKQLLDEKHGTEKRYTCFDLIKSRQKPRWHLETSDQPSLKSLLKDLGLTVLVAPHHGLESCYSQDLYDAMKGGKPELVVISERRHTNDNDGAVDGRYQREGGASGLNVEIEGMKEQRISLSTISGHHILMIFSGAGTPKVFADRKVENLIAKANA